MIYWRVNEIAKLCVYHWKAIKDIDPLVMATYTRQCKTKNDFNILARQLEENKK